MARMHDAGNPWLFSDFCLYAFAFDVVEDFLRTSAGRYGLYECRQFFVVTVFGLEYECLEEVFPHATVVGIPIELGAAFLVLFLFLLFFHQVRFLFSLFLFLHACYGIDVESSGKDGDLYLFTQFRVGGKSPLGFDIVAELFHEVIHLVHFLHHQFLRSAVFAGFVLRETDTDEYFLGVEDVVVVEER